MIKQETLFSGMYLSDYLNQKKSDLSSEIDSYKEKDLLEGDLQKLKKEIIDRYQLTVPVIDDSEIRIDKSEEEVNLSDDHNRDIVDRSKPSMVKKLKVSYHIPFEGDSDLFNYQPSSYTSNPPFGEIRGNKLVVELIVDDDNSESVKKEFGQNLNEIKEYLSSINKDITQFNSGLDSVIEQKIGSRRDKLDKDKKLVSDLGYPLKKD